MESKTRLNACEDRPNSKIQSPGNILTLVIYLSFRGLPDDLDLIKTLLERDPKRHMYETTNPHHMVNHENSFGLRPLYIACLHGHLNVKKYLTSYIFHRS
jgi:hypothetical protein